MVRHTDKVFGIGFHKTGTSSLKRALRRLGYRVTGPDHNHDPDIAQTYLDHARALSQRFDAFQDNPWPLVFREMDEMWPDAKFILTVRDPQSWIASQLRFFGDQGTPMRELIYGQGRGSPVGNEAHYIATMQSHEAAVRAYFADRPGKLLVFDIVGGAGWEPLCDFLGERVPRQPFPHANNAAVGGGGWLARLRRKRR
ncbi:MAG: sulfotransferase [Rhodobacteraceae bacterium]|nr:sulfotransferase [Paracoccaceae bacterium]